MQSSQIDFISKYNNIIQYALSAAKEFPDNLCDYLVNEYEFEAVVLLKVKDKSFELLGKSSSAKKSLSLSAELSCKNCEGLANPSTDTKFIINPQCEFKASDLVVHEGCLHLGVTEGERVVLKIAKKTEFTNIDRDNIITIGNSLRNLLRLWMGKKGGLSSSISEIVTTIGPELRTPINSILGFASLLNEESLTQTQLEYLSTLKENAYDLLSLLNDLVDLVKIETFKSTSEISEINLTQFFGDLLKMFEDKVYRNRIEIISNIDRGLPESVKCNSQKLHYIIVNLLTNSVRLTEKGKISVSVFSPEKDHLSIRISDTGVGIPSDKLKEIYNPFALADQYITTVGNTTGLGLTLVKRYVDFLNGELNISSTVGKGTTFNLTIPVEEISIIEKQISSLPKADFTNKVLVVEDDYATSKLLSNYLNKWGYEPTIVNSAEQTLKILQKERFLAILMDIVLPDANGLDLLQKIRENKNAKQTPVIICSVEAEQQKAFLMGAVEYFVKPINYKYLIEVLTNYRLRKDSNILLVDDDIPSLNLLKEAVERNGFKAIAHSDSTRVLDSIQNLHLDLAIIDLDMPDIDGIELIERIKSYEQFKNLPIIIYTGKENFEDDIKRIDGLFENLLQKRSTSLEEMQETINQMINRYEEPSTQEEVKEKKDTVKILLVEDYKHSQIIVTRLLKKNDFETIVVVENGQEALDAVKQQHYDLILMDMQMPVMNGFEATKKIRELKQYKDTPIVALTAFAMKGDREKCLDAGATDYIPKPIDSQEFIQKVKYYTEKKLVANS
ncbi:MAG: response regulator [Ignavibacteriaceae bacterium]|nr:response regulator [Ignavibacteriaceae bacterium]MCU0413047.1 response regulator [Ignavibacteriaceae bacterium]